MRFMHEVLRGLPFCFVYLDDILCYSENAEEHRSHLRTIFQRLSSYGLKLNISKCVFGVTELIFLGHLITPDGIKPLPEKVQAVLDYKQPETVGSLRKFLGLLNFYRRFLPKAAEQQYLLSEFLKGSKGKKDSKPLNSGLLRQLQHFRGVNKLLLMLHFLLILHLLPRLLFMWTPLIMP
ncbi:retrovirus-related Pol polyprotein from transposon 17.6 [Trichonephila clavipes]|nr:retrovirus-related Pol polyprotein from transposon 17.6 [Trichonephila clavipes]